MKKKHLVRGYGPLDAFIAKQRYRIVHKQIQKEQKKGCILDIGCGSYPAFLLSVDFHKKTGIDKMVTEQIANDVKNSNVELFRHEFEKGQSLSFGDNSFDVVTMLAVFEHIEPDELVWIHQEIYRILNPKGLLVVTTPAFWTPPLLWLLAKLRLISEEEIDDHKGSYGKADIFETLKASGFESDKLRFGHFEMFMNSWATAVK